MAKTGILLFAHGARDPMWAKPFLATRDRMRTQSPDAPIELAFLEFITPDILSAGTSLAERGCEDIRVVPIFLGAGGHVRKDLPSLLEQLAQRFPRVNWVLCPAVGETELLVQALAETSWALATDQAKLIDG